MNFSFLPMTGWIQIFSLVGFLFLLARPLGFYMARVLEGERTFLSPIVLPLEKTFYVLCGIDPHEEMSTSRYIKEFLVFSFICFLSLFFLLLLQDFPVIDPALAFNTSLSLLTGTDWQAYAPETTFTNNTQQFGFTIQNFLSGAIGFGLIAALARGLGRQEAGDKIGNFWVDTTRGTLYILLPLSLLLALFLLSQGVIQSFNHTLTFTTLEEGQTQTLTMGPVASQAAIKMLGTNGGGFFMANAAHPFENPTPLSNFFQILALLLIPASLTVTFGKMTGSMREGWTLFLAMMILFIPAVVIIASLEQAGNPLFNGFGLDLSLGNIEGKDLRFSTTGTSLLAAAASATSGGALNASLDSFMPLSTLIPLLLIQSGEVVFGGIGMGLGSMIAYVFFTIFIASLMIGRTPQYLGKKIGVNEMKMVALIIIIPTFFTLLGTGLALLIQAGQSAATNPGSQGFTQILYAFTSASNNNGSSFGGIAAASPFYNIALGICMLAGRFGIALAMLLMSGSFAKQGTLNTTRGTLRTDTPFFVFLLIIVIFVSMLANVPCLALGPIDEHLALLKGGIL